MWQTILHMLLTAAGHNHLSEEACPPTPPHAPSSTTLSTQLYSWEWGAQPRRCSTWIGNETPVAWSHCGWSCSWLAGAGERRRGSPRHISTGACSSWRWPAGTRRCAPAPGSFTGRKLTTVSPVRDKLTFVTWISKNTNLLVVLHHHQREATLFEIQSSDFWPIIAQIK